ncbi:hypothetical protein M441DRAFT_84246 [Trichoderma asperellum CBS 433.97]|uniref:Pentatricopeptide repeat domain-containing protein n=1 Tax=Trichoderma asperellum (strain ATCC 204424 / CBS 433.97 / NBRC 101777) TaxID=1042311 RepID=A0A2T3YTY7_TRIA4|nr:hypothetical protein M441DRAFT_84246 [Trichoderma asperellum CBS 433.97]PTB36040.1 hypothetical protein M441DRAFT_84246 [Trichoderma asperellum CBS 433.97]
MQRALPSRPNRPESTRIVFKLSAQRPQTRLRQYSQHSSALVRPSTTPATNSYDRNPWRALSAGKPSSLLQPSKWREYGSLGQVRQQHEASLNLLSSNESLAARINKTLQDTEADIQPYDAATWEAVCGVLSDMYGPDGVWAVFQSIWQGGKHEIITFNDAEALRCKILSAALSSEPRLSMLFTAARQLVAQENFQWPGLYTKIVHFFLERGDYEKVIRWDESLAPIFPVGADEFGALLATFVVKPTPEMQSTLTALYVSGANRQLYDHVIPALFASGQSKLARTWRKKLVLFKDLPLTSKSRPFLLFLANYYPHIQLTESELAVAELDREELVAEAEDDESFFEVDRKGVDRKGTHSDAFIAKWFASTWTSLEFAINLIYKLGVRTIGPRALQSLALRDPDAKEVAARIAQVERLGIRISSQSYCRILIAFARNSEDDLLIDLLHCDIHPDEFDDMETRHSLMAEAARTGDWKMERLLQGIEWAIETGPTSRRLNSLLRSELSKRSLGKAREVLDRMEALKISMAQASATGLLKRVFWKLDSHPQRSQRSQRSSHKDAGSGDFDDPFLDRALNVIRRISCHDVAIPIRYWKTLLYKLGRSRRLDELEQLSLEIMQFYTPPYGGLVPVHREDLPRHFNTEERESIPADLPFVHHHHPIRLLFDPSLQRSIVRWGFDQTLATKPQLPTTLTSLQTPSFSQFDVARGVRLLATLRDQGALIDTQVVRSSIISRIATGMVPGRPRHRARDSIEFSVENLMDLIEKAWGSEMFPDAPKVVREIEARKSKLWHQYPRLIDRTFNKDST